MRIYVAGPMTGLPGLNKETFKAAKDRLIYQGHNVMNPADLPPGFEETHYMDICMAMVRSCEAIFMLPGWKTSEGAVAEMNLAKKLGLEIFEGGTANV